jgi:arylsulfate sulfotransferase
VLFNVSKPNDPQWTRLQNYRIVLNHRGEIVFFARSRQGTPRLLQNGYFLAFNRNRLSEMDLFGTITRRWTKRAVKIPTAGIVRIDWGSPFHHACAELPNGNLLTIAKGRYPLNQYPQNDTGRTELVGRAILVGDVIIEIDRQSGTVVQSYPLVKILDPYRVCYGSTKPDPDTKFPSPLLRDWSHANSVAYDGSDDSLIVSVRNQDAIVKISRATGELVWILGCHDNWKDRWKEKLLTPIGTLEWQYHQHDVVVTSHGTVMCFDNGNYRACPPRPKAASKDNYSRAVEFEIDASNMTVRQVWSFGEKDIGLPYAARSGSVAELARTNNVFINYGTVSTDADGQYANDAGTHIYTRMVEVTRGGEIVFDASIQDPTKALSHSVYRCQYLHSLYALKICYEG